MKIALLSPAGAMHRYNGMFHKGLHYAPITLALLAALVPKELDAEVKIYEETTEEIPLDVIIYATGYDGMTGPLLRMDIKGRNGLSLNEKWESGGNVQTFLGLATNDFPNFFMITGPESPSVLVVMPTAIEQHVDWISDCINYMEKNDVDAIEPSKEVEEAWSKHNSEVAEMTLYTKGDSWYTGANIEGKPRSFLIYLGGFDHYRAKCDAVAAANYADFHLYSSIREN